jgi:hypothetical protein
MVGLFQWPKDEHLAEATAPEGLTNLHLFVPTTWTQGKHYLPK